MGRPRVVDTKDVAIRQFETFHDRAHQRIETFSFEWPRKMQLAGESKSEIYRSNKWQKSPAEFVRYKHVAESRRETWVTPGFLRDQATNRPLKLAGEVCATPEIFSDDCEEMPQHFAVLGNLLGIQLRVAVEEDGALYLPNGDEELYEVRVPHAYLGSAQHPETGETFLFVYTKAGGIHCLMRGGRLRITRDGITG